MKPKSIYEISKPMRYISTLRNKPISIDYQRNVSRDEPAITIEYKTNIGKI